LEAKKEPVPHYLTLGKLSDFPQGRMRSFNVGGQEIAVAHISGGFYAFGHFCTHRQEYLTDGFLINGQVVCAYHDATFDLTTGAALYGPAFDPLPVFSVRVLGDDLQVGWPEALPEGAVFAVNHEDEDRFMKSFII
jgi:nitrite reductase/ring-hydroxylating ferredoxin subunit